MLDFYKAPILLIMFLQDIFRDISFADDGTIWTTGTSTTHLAIIIDKNLHKPLVGTIKWRMKLSLEKTTTEICPFSRGYVDSSSPQEQLNGEYTPYNSNPKILGLHLDETLNFRHISKIHYSLQRDGLNTEID